MENAIGAARAALRLVNIPIISAQRAVRGKHIPPRLRMKTHPGGHAGPPLRDGVSHDHVRAWTDGEKGLGAMASGL